MKEYTQKLIEALKEEVANQECFWEWAETYWQTGCGNRTQNFASETCPYCDKILVQTSTVHPLLRDVIDFKVNTEKQIAHTLMDAIKMHKESYVDRNHGHTRSMEDCLIEAGKKHELSKNMWALLNLAMHWSNDVQWWCDDVLAGKDILEELKQKSIVAEQEKEILG
jgi:thiol-disulfide isomerase/thioredoxin